MNDLFVPHELPWFPVIHAFPVDPKVEPFALNKAEVLAIKALKEGNANSYQQQMALKAITERISAAHDMTFRPGDGGDRASAFAEGRRYVGLMIIRAINLPFKPSGDQPDATGTTSPALSDPHAATRRHPKPTTKRRRKPSERDPGAESAE